MPLLIALDGANPVAANWIRSALDAVVERAKAGKQSLPIAQLSDYLNDIKHAPAGRRLAFELICGPIQPPALDVAQVSG